MLVRNLADQFGTLAESVELILALLLMFSGIILTWIVQKWADRSPEQPSAANLGQANTHQHEENTMRD